MKCVKLVSLIPAYKWMKIGDILRVDNGIAEYMVNRKIAIYCNKSEFKQFNKDKHAN